MSLLLDSHVLLWWVTDHPRLPQTARTRIREAPRVVVSTATPWELGLKYAKGRLDGPSLAELHAAVVDDGMEVLDVRWDHAAAASSLPAHHGDPFDRMLVAQARVERLTIVTRDRRIRDYDVATTWDES